MKERLNPQKLEERTQAIGRELFAAAKAQHAHLSALNAWTARVLSWCLGDPAVKASVLRFIDVLPSLQRPRDIVQHVRDYFPPDFRLPAALRLGASLAGPAPLTQGALSAIIRQLVEQVARQFIADASPEGASRAMQDLAHRGATCSVDILGEQVLSEEEAQRYVGQCERLLALSRAVADGLAPAPFTCGASVNLSVKPSALTPRFDPISPRHSLAQAGRRLQPLLRHAAAQGASINLDMEQYEFRDLTLALAKDLALGEEEPQGAALGVVIQAYLRDAEVVTEELLAWLATHERRMTIRLVKGAYWDYEVAQAKQRGWPVPVYEEKRDTDAAFERLTRRLLSAFPLVTTAIASHNVRSIAQAMAAAEVLGLERGQLEFQLLYGMGDVLHGAIIGRGYPVRIYTPIGELIPGMAYLVRRILENTANESFLRQEFTDERSVEELLRAPEPQPARPAPPASAESWHGEPLLDFSREPERRRFSAALSARRNRLGDRHPLLLDGQWVDAQRQLLVHNPAAPGEVVGTVAEAAVEDVDRAVRAAQAAQPQWAATPATERIACLRRAAVQLRRRREEFAALAVLEVGKTWREADVEIVEAIEYLEYYGAQMAQLAGGRALPQLPGERNAYVYRPRGVAAVIAPWNFPAAILTGMTGAALVSGNPVILKPAERSSVIAVELARVLQDAGLPPGVLQVLPGAGETVGAALVRHPGIQTVLFTGSKSVGLKILKACGTVAAGQRMVKHAIVEMGGKNAIIVDADADLDAAVQGILRSAFGYAGQKCSAASRLIVDRAVADRLMPRLIAATDRLVVGNPSDPETDLGPLIEAGAQRRLREAMAHAERVATVAYRYPSARLPKEGHYVGPAIVTHVPIDDRLAREELFGPLVCVFQVNGIEEALRLANDSDYALTGGIYSRSPAHIARAIAAFDVGNFYINRPITGAMVARQPFGGHRLSGLGTKAGGPDYLLQLLVPKTISTNTTRHGMPLDEQGS